MHDDFFNLQSFHREGKLMYIAFISVFLVVLFIPGEALAWGPATHLELGRDVLNNLGLLTSSVRVIIETFPYDFLYGNISADIVIGKNLAKELKHCHNWKIGFNLRKKADSDSKKAFAYGYLSHLAADTIAHNLFIPEKMVRSFSTRVLRHIYWELRFDALVDKAIWKIPKKIEREVHRENDKFLDSVLHEAFLSFRTSKTIFSSIILLHRMEKWHRMIDVLSSRSRWELKKGERMIYYGFSLDAMLSLLNEGEAAQCIKKDPTGKLNINTAKVVRRRLKRLKRNGLDWEAAMNKALRAFPTHPRSL
jgi:hypothetical protein